MPAAAGCQPVLPARPAKSARPGSAGHGRCPAAQWTPIRLRRFGVKKHAAAWVKGLLKYGIGFALLAFMIARNWEPKGNNPGIRGLLQQTPDLLAFAAIVLLVVVCT